MESDSSLLSLSRVAQRLSYVADKVGYSGFPKTSNLHRKAVVLLIGNYSSGKSSFVNELLGMEIQRVGQAPTDDSFTIITAAEDSAPPMIEGGDFIHRDDLPFADLSRHGNAFLSHIQMKNIQHKDLNDLILIDSPGMLDSMTDMSRGYPYHEVVRDLSNLSDLILVFFDTHKAGTVGELYQQIKKYLPSDTRNNRLVFVLNRVDECENLEDLLRVFGSLCWNLSQMLGIKDIPPIYLSYHQKSSGRPLGSSHSFLDDLKNQRESLKNRVLAAKDFRKTHLKQTMVEHGERLHILIQALTRYQNQVYLKGLTSLLLGGVIASVILAVLWSQGLVSPELNLVPFATGLVALLIGVLIMYFRLIALRSTRPENLLKFAPQGDQLSRDRWQAVQADFLKNVRQRSFGHGGLRRLSEVKIWLRKLKSI